MKPRPTDPLVLALFALAGCGGAEGAAPSSSVRDSAGIQIVENTGQGRRWSVGEAPTLDIGVTEGEAAYQLDRVRAVLRLADGRIVVGNSGTDELRVFDGQGRHLATAGGSGAGPGEFNSIAALSRLPGDSLLVFDAILRRVSLFDPTPRFVRSHNLPEDGMAQLADRLDDGTLLLSRTRLGLSGGDVTDRTVRDTVVWLRWDPAGGRVDSLGRTPGREQMISLGGQEGGRMTMSIASFPFLRDVEAAAGRGGFWQGVTERYELAFRRPDGAPVRIVRREHPAVPVEGAYLDSLRRVRERETESRPARDALDAVALPPALPAFTRLLVDDEAHLWVQQMPWPGEDVPPEWEVFTPEGRLVARVELPARFQAMQVGRDFVLGVWKDEDDVEHVRMYTLTRS